MTLLVVQTVHTRIAVHTQIKCQTYTYDSLSNQVVSASKQYTKNIPKLQVPFVEM